MSLFQGKKAKALRRLDACQLADYHAALHAMKGLTTPQAASALSRSGTNYYGCPKWYLATKFANRDARHVAGMRNWSIDTFKSFCDIQRQIVETRATHKPRL